MSDPLPVWMSHTPQRSAYEWLAQGQNRAMYCGCSIVNEQNAMSGHCGDNYLKLCPLHAAAPELLKTLQQMRSKFDPSRSSYGFVTKEDLANVDAAIAHAEGRG